MKATKQKQSLFVEARDEIKGFGPPHETMTQEVAQSKALIFYFKFHLALRSGSIVAYEVYPRRDYC